MFILAHQEEKDNNDSIARGLQEGSKASIHRLDFKKNGRRNVAFITRQR
jgi:hypothetical protein